MFKNFKITGSLFLLASMILLLTVTNLEAQNGKGKCKKNQSSCCSKYVDANNDGKCDNFVDANNDGKCDDCTKTCTNDGTGCKGNKSCDNSQSGNKKCSNFVDANNDGKCDNFVDANNDGKCDDCTKTCTNDGTGCKGKKHGNNTSCNTNKSCDGTAKGTKHNCSNFVDENKDGKCDNFSDSDNDGVCDNKKSEYKLNNNFQNMNMDLQTYPNPADNSTKLTFDLNQQGTVNIQIANESGIVLNTINAGTMNSGKNEFNLSNLDLKPGHYFITITNGSQKETKQILISK